MNLYVVAIASALAGALAAYLWGVWVVVRAISRR